MASKLPKDGTALYVSMDDLFFIDNNLYEVADEFVKLGGKYLLLDEVHKYLNWSREIKLIYDDMPYLQVAFASSSILEIFSGRSGLSRRAISYDLKEMSLREFIVLESKIILPPVSFNDIIHNHIELSSHITSKIKPLAAFKNYLKYGAYPYFIEDKELYLQRLLHTVNLIIDVDLNAVEQMNYDSLTKIKKLLRAIATSVPFIPNISKLSEKTNISRPKLIRTLYQLERARLVIQLNKARKGIGILTKPEKLYLNNVNLLQALAADIWDIGTARETFFINQLTNSAQINLAIRGDFLINEKYTFEIGGRNKTRKQIQGLKDAFVARDDIEYGVGSTIPLWLFGFLY